jgi:pimeloyl-ACP methyl ester carboxylesterase
MDIVLVPGLWLNASTWNAVVPALTAAGHRPFPLTLPGMEGRDSDRSGITLGDHVAAVVEAMDAAGADGGGPVLLVGHSAGCGLAHAALDARPDRVARVVHVGGFPCEDGEPLLSGLEARDGEVEMPDWRAIGEEANVVDFSDEQLAEFYAAAVPVPERVVTDPVRLADERRFAVPATLVCPEYTAADVREWVTEGHLPEVERTARVEYVDLPGGHWPQLTQPDALARVLLDEAARR